ncbi:dihydroxyacetone kinase [Verruconis gallopava]|uniref:Dihydroxyacetone kinase n=1 Tax=Verruconis gallopava TaxID=253628 RepID=A0A0D1YGH2_9PEZI|nr:dihydroxyacetone kinase [Verruconis gallopava]KIV99896.1 dihydroxyacetone kinase [Verruconis gallopava]
MAIKHFINSSEEVTSLIYDSLEALIYQHSDLALDRKEKIVFHYSKCPPNGVALISGGGAGHEPAHAAFVGEGMLTAAVSGNIFASPAVSQILSAIRRVTGPAGAILIIKNYTGDIFHFHQAAERARAAYGLRVEVVVVGDDVAVGRKKSGKVGRRGLAGTVLVHKILGAMAAKSGATIDELLAMAKKITSGLATIGASLDHVHLPGHPVNEMHHLKHNEIEVGMGIHNEPGVSRWNPQPSLSAILDRMISNLTDNEDEDRAYVNFASAESIILLVNNLGALSQIELGSITTHTVRKLESRGFRLSRVLSGTFMSSLNGPGFSITLLSATNAMLPFLDSPTNAIGWPLALTENGSYLRTNGRIIDSETSPCNDVQKVMAEAGIQVVPQTFSSIVGMVCQSAIDFEPEITHADTIVGDGDCGMTLKRGCKAIQQHFRDNSSSSLTHNLLEIAHLVDSNMDGTSGAIYSLFFNGLASSVQDLSKAKFETLNLEFWASAAENALVTVQKATPARLGDRTIMDALEPFVNTLKEGVECAYLAAKKGMESTKGIPPAFGRSVYVNEAGWYQVPDPGAMSVVALAKGLQNAMQ